MSTPEIPPAVDPQALADLEEVCRLVSEGKQATEPELIARTERRAAEATYSRRRSRR